MNIYVIVFDSDNCLGFSQLLVGQESLAKWLKDFEFASCFHVREYSPDGCYIGQANANDWKILLTG